ncbi:putative secreted protein [Pseudomonas sp. CFII64]|nr:putative secreted protein [Pseudomonas sp. CFII64]
MPLRAPGKSVQVASLLPLLPHSRERRDFFGVCDEAWACQRAPFAPLDTDPRWFDEVAQDQVQPDYWAGNEAWSVAGMHPSKLEVVGRLPGFRPRLFVERASIDSQAKPASAVDRAIEEVKLELDTVWLFPDVERVLLVYRAQIPVRDIDGEDLAAVALRCERETDSYKSRDQWIAELWRQSHIPSAESQAQRGKAAPEQEEKLNKLGADLIANATVFLKEQERLLGFPSRSVGVVNPILGIQAVQADERNLASLLPKLQESLAGAHELLPDEQRINPSTLERLFKGTQTATDEEAINAEVDAFGGESHIDQRLVQTQEHLRQEVAALASLVGRDPVALLDEIHAAAKPPDPLLAQVQLDALRAETDLHANLVELEAGQQQELEQIAGELGIPLEDLMAEMRAQDPLLRFSVLQADAHPLPGSIEAEEAAVQIEEIETLIAALKNITVGSLLADIQPEWTRELLQTSHANGLRLTGEHFASLDLSHLDLSAADLQNCVFQNCQLRGTSFSGADLSHGRFIDCELDNVDMTKACLDGAFFERSSMNGARAKEASFHAVYAKQCGFDNADFSGCHGQDIQWVECSFTAASLQRVNWPRARWQRCNLGQARIADAQLVKTQFYACQLDAVELSRADLQEASWSCCEGVEVDLSCALLKQWRLEPGCRLPAVRLDGADLSDASLQHAYLTHASLSGVNLSRALVSCCDLSDSSGYHLSACSADFTGSDLSRASWVGANLLETTLRKVNLSQTDLSGSNLHGSVTEGVIGEGTKVSGALMTRCRLSKDLANA